MIEINVFSLDNNEYYEVDNIPHNGNNYLILSKVLDNSDICVRRLVNEDGNDKLLNVTDDEKITIMELFVEKNKALFG